MSCSAHVNGYLIQAIDYHQRAMLLQQSTSNSAKAMTAETCVLMGMVKAKMGHYQKALDLYEDALLVLKASVRTLIVCFSRLHLFT